MSPSAPPAPERFGIDAPFRLFVAGRLGRPGQPVLRIFDLDEADFAEIAGLDHFARAPHQGIAGVIVRQRENAARFLDRGSCIFFASASEVVSGLSQMT